MKTYRDGDGEYTIIRPGERLPGEYTGPTERGDFAWVRRGLPSRWREMRHGKALGVLNDNLKLATQHNEQTAAYVRSQQAIVHARNQERLLPLKIAEEEATLQLGIVRTHGAMHDELERRKRSRVEHKRRMTELKGERKAAKSRNKQARRARRHARDAERRRPYDQGPRPNGATDAFDRHYRTMEEVKANLSEGERRIQAIYAAAAARRRNLTDDELMEIDAIADAAQAARDEVIRTGASDFGGAHD